MELSDRYPSVVDRYFTRRYVLKEGRRDVCLLFHSNKICVVTLAKSHALVQDRVPIAKVFARVSFRFLTATLATLFVLLLLLLPSRSTLR